MWRKKLQLSANRLSLVHGILKTDTASPGRWQPYTQVRLVNTDSSGVSLRSCVKEETKCGEQCQRQRHGALGRSGDCWGGGHFRDRSHWHGWESQPRPVSKQAKAIKWHCPEIRINSNADTHIHYALLIRWGAFKPDQKGFADCRASHNIFPHQHLKAIAPFGTSPFFPLLF